MMFIPIIVIGIIVYFLVTNNKFGNTPGNTTGTSTGSNPQVHASHSNTKIPIDILNERYAKGEIDEEEYANRKRLLNQ